MSKTKKIISAVIAIVLMINVFAVASFAAVPAGYDFKLSFEPVGKIEAGKTALFNLCYEIPESASLSDYMMGKITLNISFDASVFTPQTTYSGVLDNADMDYIKVQCSTLSGTQLTTLQKAFSAAEIAKYPDVFKTIITLDPNAGSGYASNTGYPLPAKSGVICTYAFDVAETYNGETAELLASSFDAAATVASVVNKQVNKKAVKITTDVSEAVLKNAEEYKVFDGAVKIRKNAADNTKYDLGFTGSFEDFDPEFAESGTSATIKSVGCEVTINGVTNTYTDRYVYEGTTYGKYAFRVAVGAFGPYDTNEVSIRMFVELNEAVDGQTKFYSEGITTTMNEQIQARDS